MGKIVTQCPSCRSVKVHAAKMECVNCHTTFEGRFEIPALLKLRDEDLQFIVEFVKCSGSLKEMAAKQKVSYPTLRNRLNELIEVLENLETKKEGSKTDILKWLEEGIISAQEAAKLLQTVKI